MGWDDSTGGRCFLGMEFGVFAFLLRCLRLTLMGYFLLYKK